MSRLALTLDWQPGEAPMSLISRVAAMNGAGLIQDFVRDMGLDWEKVCAGSVEQIGQMAALLRIDPHAFQYEMIATVPTGKCHFRGQVLDRGMVNRKSIRVCPECLFEDQTSRGLAHGYGRSVWQLAQYRICPDHKRLLVELPAPARPRDMRDFEKVIADEAEKDRNPLFDRPGSFEAWLTKRLNGESDADWPDKLDISVAALLCEKLGVLMTYGRTAHGNLNLDKLASATEYGFRRLQKGMSGALDEAWQRNRRSRRGFRKHFGNFWSWLATSAEDPRFAPLLDAVTGLAFKVSALPVGAVVLGRRCPERNRHTVHSAAHAHGLNVSRAARLLKTSALAQRSGSSSFQAGEADAFLETVGASLSRKAALERFGVSPDTVDFH